MPYFILGCCDCVEPIFSTYSHCSLSVHNINNAGAAIEMDGADTLLKNAYGIRVKLDRIEGTCKKKKSVFSSAYAFSCNCPSAFQYVQHNRITGIKIKTNSDFDIGHAAGDTVNSYFYEYNRYTKSTYIPINEFVQSLNGTYGQDQEKTLPHLEFDMLLMSPPTNAGNYSFEIEILFADNKVLKATTQTVYLK